MNVCVQISTQEPEKYVRFILFLLVCIFKNPFILFQMNKLLGSCYMKAAPLCSLL